MMNVLHRWQGRFAAYRRYRRTISAISRVADADGLDLGEPTGGVIADVSW